MMTALSSGAAAMTARKRCEPMTHRGMTAAKLPFTEWIIIAADPAVASETPPSSEALTKH